MAIAFFIQDVCFVWIIAWVSIGMRLFLVLFCSPKLGELRLKFSFFFTDDLLVRATGDSEKVSELWHTA
ncbi:hypothetical protein [Tychonema sp. LEGE 07203]|uniref:hypothetical protein n=1 Tax=Tychonema sp. LEGE 07203 TaxID=1828671 RepID=UPI00187E6311|nr:hypothetical protein [Tychonema sp. LEGE 07203]MBE9095412.1 hypothetical protein [Tychonema sp. LEGE 07203]